MNRSQIENLLTFEQQKQLIELDLEVTKKKHKLKMKALTYIRETNKILHQQELEKTRIRSEEIRRTQMRKKNYK